jgi:hypothetical protein
VRFWLCRWRRISIPSLPSAFTRCRGRALEFTWGHTPKVDGKALDYAAWPLFGGPYLEAAVDSEQLVMKHGGLRALSTSASSLFATKARDRRFECAAGLERPA